MGRPKKEVGVLSEETDVLTEEHETSREEEILKTKFDKNKKYMFELAAENDQRELPIMVIQNNKASVEPHKRFKPYVNIVYESQVVWHGERRNLRYYDGCTSIFQDEQPKDEKLIAGLVKRTKKRAFLEGKFGCFGDERMLLLYMIICSWNTESEFRTKTATECFRPSNADKKADEQSSRMDAIEKALAFAREATSLKMRMHASYMGIPEIDYESGNEWTEKELRSMYRQEAGKNPFKFIESYGNKSLEIKWLIEKALQSGTISSKQTLNKATWKGSGTVICDISGIKSHDAISNSLFEFSQSEAGEDFVIQLKALYS